MKKLLFLIFAFISVFANNIFTKVNTTILTTSKNSAIINTKIIAGETGYVIHNNMMIAKVLSIGNGNVRYLPLVKLANEGLATPNIMPKVKDHIVFGLYNKKALIIAPTQKIYLKLKQNNPNINFINSDIFASYFETKPTIEDFHKFCRDFNIGLIYFVLDKEYIVDSESFIILVAKKTETAKYTKPFFATYNKFTTMLFSSKPNDFGTYYKSMLKKVK